MIDPMADLRARLMCADDERFRAVLGEVLLEGAGIGFVAGFAAGSIVTALIWVCAMFAG